METEMVEEIVETGMRLVVKVERQWLIGADV